MSAVALCLAASTAQAQIYIQQDGRLLDANPQIGYGGLNPSRPVSPLLSGNAFATGNVGRGLSLRSDSPITSPYTFGVGLGSASLSNFRRDSVSVADAAAPYGGLLPRIYYDPTQTVFTPRYFGPQQVPTPSVGAADLSAGLPGVTERPLLQPGFRRLTGTPALGGGIGAPTPPVDLRLDASAAPRLGLTTQIQGWTPAPSNALDSAIFGPRGRSPSYTLPSYTTPSSTSGLVGDLSTPGAPRLPGPSDLLDSPLAGTQPLAPEPAQPLGTPLDLLIRGAGPSTLLTPNLRSGVEGTTGVPGLPGLVEERQSLAAGMGHERVGRPAAGPRVTPLGLPVLPGLDLFTDIQLAAGLSRDPSAAWFGEMKSVIRTNPSLATEMQDLLAMDAARFAESVLSQPIRSFVGRGDSALNETLLRGEMLLHERQYFGAVSQYERARLIDPLNPLPLLGKGHASLAAGDYLTAVHNILAGLQRYPEMMKLAVDLKAFMGGEAIDIRRADLMQQLERREDPRLRFLLGYLEYYGGNKQSGLSNLEKAAKGAPVGSFIQQFPALLTGQRTLPPPKLPLSSFLGRPKSAEESLDRLGIGTEPAPVETPANQGERKEP